MSPPFSSPVCVLLPSELADLRPLFEANRTQLERELGGPWTCGVADPGAPLPSGPCFLLRLGAERAALRLDRAAGRLIAEAPERPGLFEALSLLRDLHGLEGDILEVRDCTTAEEAVERTVQTIESSWPSFALGRVSWPKVRAELRREVRRAEDPMAALREGLAPLGDTHTGLRPSRPWGFLPYRARYEDGQLRLHEVPEGTVAHGAGVRAGDVLAAVDADRLWRENGGTPQGRPWVVGLRALSGPLGEEARMETRAGMSWREIYERLPWPEPVEVSRLPGGVGYLRLRAWDLSLEQALSEGLESLRGCARLIFDLRGNGGGNFLMAKRFQSRFLRTQGQLGWIAYTLPGGGLGPLEPLEGAPGPPRLRWDKPLEVWTDGQTYSASEDFLLGLAGQPDVRVCGTRSGGGSGRCRVIRLLSGWRLIVTTCHTFGLDGHCIEGAGVPVDGPIVPPV